MDDTPWAQGAVSGGAQSEVGVQLASERGDTAPSYARSSHDEAATARATGTTKSEQL